MRDARGGTRARAKRAANRGGCSIAIGDALVIKYSMCLKMVAFGVYAGFVGYACVGYAFAGAWVFAG